MKYCNSCGAMVGDSAPFCGNCGARFDYQPYNQQQFYPNQEGRTSTASTSPSGLSISAFILSFFVAPVALILGIVALAKKDGLKKGFATAAVVISAFGGFTLLILLAVMLPSWIKYVEKTNVSRDLQLCEHVKLSISHVINEPTVLGFDGNTVKHYSDGNWYNFEELGGETNVNTFKGAVRDVVGYDPADVENRTKSTYQGRKAYGVQFRILDQTKVEVRILHSDLSGGKGKLGANPIYVK